MSDDLEAADAIGHCAERLLRDAGAYDRFPTPVEDIVAANQSRGDAYPLEDRLIAKAPDDIRELLHSAQPKIQGFVEHQARTVHVAPAIEHDGKRRFVVLHETIHVSLPHQRDLRTAADHEMLVTPLHRLFEREANHGAAELLFQRDRLTRDARDLAISVSAVNQLAERYGASFHATLRRYAETHRDAVAALVLDRTPFSCAPTAWRQRQAPITSQTWANRFGSPEWPAVMSVSDYPFLVALEFREADRVSLHGLGSSPVTVCVDTLQTPFNSFVLLWVPPPRLVRPRPTESTSTDEAI